MTANRRPFRIEAADPRARSAEAETPLMKSVSSFGHFDRIIGELTDLRVLLERIETRDREAKQRGGEALLIGVEAIHQAIRKTRSEIVSIKSNGKGETLYRATDELDAVVADTESATETILEAAETIDGIAGRLIPTLEGDAREQLVEMRSQAIRIFEACNFQDISGQRISKVVNLMQFIEQRIMAMTEIWGITEIESDPAAEARKPTGDEALLNGPALATDENVVSQDDIDSLFP